MNKVISTKRVTELIRLKRILYRLFSRHIKSLLWTFSHLKSQTKSTHRIITARALILFYQTYAKTRPSHETTIRLLQSYLMFRTLSWSSQIIYHTPSQPKVTSPLANTIMAFMAKEDIPAIHQTYFPPNEMKAGRQSSLASRTLNTREEWFSYSPEEMAALSASESACGSDFLRGVAETTNLFLQSASLGKDARHSPGTLDATQNRILYTLCYSLKEITSALPCIGLRFLRNLPLGVFHQTIFKEFYLVRSIIASDESTGNLASRYYYIEITCLDSENEFIFRSEQYSYTAVNENIAIWGGLVQHVGVFLQNLFLAFPMLEKAFTAFDSPQENHAACLTLLQDICTWLILPLEIAVFDYIPFKYVRHIILSRSKPAEAIRIACKSNDHDALQLSLSEQQAQLADNAIQLTAKLIESGMLTETDSVGFVIDAPLADTLLFPIKEDYISLSMYCSYIGADRSQQLITKDSVTQQYPAHRHSARSSSHGYYNRDEGNVVQYLDKHKVLAELSTSYFDEYIIKQTFLNSAAHLSELLAALRNPRIFSWLQSIYHSDSTHIKPLSEHESTAEKFFGATLLHNLLRTNSLRINFHTDNTYTTPGIINYSKCNNSSPDLLTWIAYFTKPTGKVTYTSWAHFIQIILTQAVTLLLRKTQSTELVTNLHILHISVLTHSPHRTKKCRYTTAHLEMRDTESGERIEATLPTYPGYAGHTREGQYVILFLETDALVDNIKNLLSTYIVNNISNTQTAHIRLLSTSREPLYYPMDTIGYSAVKRRALALTHYRKTKGISLTSPGKPTYYPGINALLLPGKTLTQITEPCFRIIKKCFALLLEYPSRGITLITTDKLHLHFDETKYGRPHGAQIEKVRHRFSATLAPEKYSLDTEKNAFHEAYRNRAQTNLSLPIPSNIMHKYVRHCSRALTFFDTYVTHISNICIQLVLAELYDSMRCHQHYARFAQFPADLPKGATNANTALHPRRESTICIEKVHVIDNNEIHIHCSNHEKLQALAFFLGQLSLPVQMNYDGKNNRLLYVKTTPGNPTHTVIKLLNLIRKKKTNYLGIFIINEAGEVLLAIRSNGHTDYGLIGPGGHNNNPIAAHTSHHVHEQLKEFGLSLKVGTNPYSAISFMNTGSRKVCLIEAKHINFKHQAAKLSEFKENSFKWVALQDLHKHPLHLREASYAILFKHLEKAITEQLQRLTDGQLALKINQDNLDTFGQLIGNTKDRKLVKWIKKQLSGYYQISIKFLHRLLKEETITFNHTSAYVLLKKLETLSNDYTFTQQAHSESKGEDIDTPKEDHHASDSDEEPLDLKKRNPHLKNGTALLDPLRLCFRAGTKAFERTPASAGAAASASATQSNRKPGAR